MHADTFKAFAFTRSVKFSALEKNNMCQMCQMYHIESVPFISGS